MTFLIFRLPLPEMYDRPSLRYFLGPFLQVVVSNIELSCTDQSSRRDVATVTAELYSHVLAYSKDAASRLLQRFLSQTYNLFSGRKGSTLLYDGPRSTFLWDLDDQLELLRGLLLSVDPAFSNARDFFQSLVKIVIIWGMGVKRVEVMIQEGLRGLPQDELKRALGDQYDALMALDPTAASGKMAAAGGSVESMTRSKLHKYDEV